MPEGDSHAAFLGTDERYRVLGTLGQGGVGTVYRVHDRELDEILALKVMRPELSSDPYNISRFKQEIKTARRINHPNVARVYHLFRWRDRLAIALEYIDGRSLDLAIAEGPLAALEITRLVRYICSALDAAHRLGVIHRDLKPGNIMIDRRGEPRIVDFGLAVLAEALRSESQGWTVGTPTHMSPEQASRPDDVDHRSDIYSLGVCMYEMATAKLPFQHRDPRELMILQCRGTVPPPSTHVPDLHRGLEGVILRCLEKDPDDRYQSAGQVYDELERVCSGPSASVPNEDVTGRVLIVDDDEACRLLVRAVLEKRGIEVVEASDGERALERAREEGGLSFILLDIQMPVMDGREALRALKADPRTSSIPVVMLTGLSDGEEALMSKERGAAHFLNKPVQPDILDLLAEKYVGQ